MKSGQYPTEHIVLDDYIGFRLEYYHSIYSEIIDSGDCIEFWIGDLFCDDELWMSKYKF